MKLLTSTKIIVCALVFSATSTLAVEDKQLDTVTAFIKSIKKETGFNSGTAVAVVKNGEIIFQQNIGYADINGDKKIDDDTAFYIASATKPFFALATLLAEKQGHIKDSTSLTSMFTNMDLTDVNPDKVTVKHLLAHTSGIDNYPLLNATAYTGLHDNAHRHYLVSQSKPHLKKKLNEYKYTNIGYNILSVWFDDYFGQEWQKTLSNSVFEPMSLQQTSAYMSDARRNGIQVALPYSYFNKTQNEPLYLSKTDNTMHAAGGMFASAKDLAKFLIAQTNNGKIDGKQIFPVDVIHKSHQVLTRFTSDERAIPSSGYAWGWMVGEYKNEIIYHHGGGFTGTRTHLSFMPEHNIGVVVLSNEDYVSAKLNNAIVDLVYSNLLKDPKIDHTLTNYHTDIINNVSKMKVLVEKDRENRAKRVMELSLDDYEYSGVYANPLLGDLSIHQTVTNKFKLTWGNMKAIAEAYKHLDTMRIEFVPGRGWKVKFDIKNNKVVGIDIEGEYFKKRS